VPCRRANTEVPWVRSRSSSSGLEYLYSAAVAGNGTVALPLRRMLRATVEGSALRRRRGLHHLPQRLKLARCIGLPGDLRTVLQWLIDGHQVPDAHELPLHPRGLLATAIGPAFASRQLHHFLPGFGQGFRPDDDGVFPAHEAALRILVAGFVEFNEAQQIAAVVPADRRECAVEGHAVSSFCGGARWTHRREGCPNSASARQPLSLRLPFCAFAGARDAHQVAGARSTVPAPSTRTSPAPCTMVASRALCPWRTGLADGYIE
jgi:hypothetical protein